jgi:NAD(P)-dependent dehydrogenase (short-subunit alcohol dehydrogenase family)
LEKVLIAGASRGLGYALADAYAGKGFFVIACARDTSSPQLAALKKKHDDTVRLVVMDVSRTDSVEQAALRVRRDVHDLDILINNAGVHAEDSFSELEKVNVDNCLATFNINALGPLRVTKAFLDLLEKGTVKELVNISSESGSISDTTRVKEFDYCMSKAALNMQSKLLQNYLGSRGIKVLSLHPGWMRTDMGGPRATFSPVEAAARVIEIADRYRSVLQGPIFVDYTGKTLNY